MLIVRPEGVLTVAWAGLFCTENQGLAPLWKRLASAVPVPLACPHRGYLSTPCSTAHMVFPSCT